MRLRKRANKRRSERSGPRVPRDSERFREDDAGGDQGPSARAGDRRDRESSQRGGGEGDREASQRDADRRDREASKRGGGEGDREASQRPAGRDREASKRGGDRDRSSTARKGRGDRRRRSQSRGAEGRERGEHGDRPGRSSDESVPAQLAAIVGALLGGLAALATAAARALRGPAGRLRRGAAAPITAASRALTPARALLIAAVGCAVLLGLAQFADYRGVAIGAGAYEGVQSVAPAPEVDREELGSAHAYALLPAALIAIAALLLAARSGRWRLCRLAIVVGLAAIVVTIVVDRPAGLDEGFASRDFADAEAKLLGGFWTQLFAGIGLVLTSGLLAREIRKAGPGRSSSRAQRPKGREMSVATAAGRTGAGGAEA